MADLNLITSSPAAAGRKRVIDEAQQIQGNDLRMLSGELALSEAIRTRNAEVGVDKALREYIQNLPPDEQGPAQAAVQQGAAMGGGAPPAVMPAAGGVSPAPAAAGAPAGGQIPQQLAGPAPSRLSFIKADLARKLASVPGGGKQGLGVITAGETAYNEAVNKHREGQFKDRDFGRQVGRDEVADRNADRTFNADQAQRGVTNRNADRTRRDTVAGLMGTAMKDGNIPLAQYYANEIGFKLAPEAWADVQNVAGLGRAMTKLKDMYPNEEQRGKVLQSVMRDAQATGGDWDGAISRALEAETPRASPRGYLRPQLKQGLFAGKNVWGHIEQNADGTPGSFTPILGDDGNMIEVLRGSGSTKPIRQVMVDDGKGGQMKAYAYFDPQKNTFEPITDGSGKVLPAPPSAERAPTLRKVVGTDGSITWVEFQTGGRTIETGQAAGQSIQQIIQEKTRALGRPMTAEEVEVEVGLRNKPTQGGGVSADTESRRRQARVAALVKQYDKTVWDQRFAGPELNPERYAMSSQRVYDLIAKGADDSVIIQELTGGAPAAPAAQQPAAGAPPAAQQPAAAQPIPTLPDGKPDASKLVPGTIYQGAGGRRGRWNGTAMELVE